MTASAAPTAPGAPRFPWISPWWPSCGSSRPAGRLLTAWLA